MINSKNLLLPLAFTCGFAIMALELLGFRLLAPYFGSCIYVWGSLIGIVMVALSGGYYIGGRISDKKPDRDLLFGLVLIADVMIFVFAVTNKPILQFCTKFGMIYGSLIATTILFGLPMLLLSMVSPYVIKLLTEKDREGSIAGKVYAVSTGGSILGTFFASFFSIPTFGTRMTFFALAIILLIISVLGLSFKRKSYIVLLLLVLFIFAPGGVEDPKVVYATESVYNSIKVTGIKNEAMLLSLNNVPESIYFKNRILTGYYYDYFSLAPILVDAEEKDILILGLGGGTSVIQHFDFFGDVTIDAVEIDPKVIDVAREYFHLEDDPRLNIYICDARPFLSNTDMKYDIIDVDLYTGAKYPPFYTVTQDFFELTYEHLNEGGVLMMNAYHSEAKSALAESIINTIKSVYPYVYTINLARNTMIIATKQEINITEKLQNNNITQLEPVTKEALAKIKEFEYKEDVKVLTDDHAPVERLAYIAITGEKKAEVEAPAPAIWVWGVLGAVLVIVVIAGVWYMKKRKRE